MWNAQYVFVYLPAPIATPVMASPPATPRTSRPSSPTSNVVVLPSGMSIHIKGKSSMISAIVIQNALSRIRRFMSYSRQTERKQNVDVILDSYSFKLGV